MEKQMLYTNICLVTYSWYIASGHNWFYASRDVWFYERCFATKSWSHHKNLGSGKVVYWTLFGLKLFYTNIFIHLQFYSARYIAIKLLCLPGCWLIWNIFFKLIILTLPNNTFSCKGGISLGCDHVVNNSHIRVSLMSPGKCLLILQGSELLCQRHATQSH